MSDFVPSREGLPTPELIDLKAQMVLAARSLSQPVPGGSGPGKAARMTSDLSIDEELVLHSIGWEPVELVSGISIHSIPAGVWNWGQGEISYASAASARSFASATDRIHQACQKVGGQGVVGVHVEWEVHRHHIDVALVGTAVRPVAWTGLSADPVFVSDLSGRDFALLHTAGWMPVGLAAGASYVYAPRRSASTAMKQKGQNVELTNFTEAMYASRESAMERMQASALALDGTGVVEVKVTEGPMQFAHHAVGFTAYGTVVRLVADAHRHVGAQMILPMDDPAASFDAAALRGL